MSTSYSQKLQNTKIVNSAILKNEAEIRISTEDNKLTYLLIDRTREREDGKPKGKARVGSVVTNVG